MLLEKKYIDRSDRVNFCHEIKTQRRSFLLNCDGATWWYRTYYNCVELTNTCPSSEEGDHESRLVAKQRKHVEYKKLAKTVGVAVTKKIA